jgi:DNA helicase-2/ATP-dependent DNA helicase PcrA
MCARMITTEELNPSQRVAIEHGEGPMVVVAGPGTGKTSVITERIRCLIESDPALEGGSILGLTYTDKAAGEMLHRVHKSLGERASGICLKTFHSFCYEVILKQRFPELETLDQTDHWIFLRRNFAALGIRHYTKLSDIGGFLDDFISFFSRCQDHLVTPDGFQQYADSRLEEYQKDKNTLDTETQKQSEGELDCLQEVARAYRVSEELLREENLITYGGQIHRAVNLLKGDASLLRELQTRFRFVLVDEFQDTNRAQIELLWLLAGEHRNIFVVGDHNQAIYRFRGASFGSFHLLARYFGASTADGQPPRMPSIRLWRNYRSSRHILNVAQHVIEMNGAPPQPEWAGKLEPNREGGPRIRVANFGSAADEAAWITGEIQKAHASGEPWRNFAILYRMHAHREELLNVFRERDIPFSIRNLSILHNALCRDLIAWLRLINSGYDNVACARVLGMPYWRFTPEDIVRLAERAGHDSLFNTLDAQQHELPFSEPQRRTAELLEFVSGLRQQSRKMRASEFFTTLVQALEITPLAKGTDALVLARVGEFIRDWERKGSLAGEKRLHDFIRYLEFFLEAKGKITLEENPGSDGVQLMTVHGAKGLEFPHVFVIRLGKGDFPGREKKQKLEFPTALMKDEKPEEDFHTREERRLFYVALTRAQLGLTVTAVINNRKGASVFFEDVRGSVDLLKCDLKILEPTVSQPSKPAESAPPPASTVQSSLFSSAGAPTRVFSQIAAWANNYRPPLETPLPLSASAVDGYNMCALKFLFSDVWGIGGGAHSQLTFGNVIHNVLRQLGQSVLKGHRISLEDFLGIYEREWKSIGFLDDVEEQEYKKAGREQLTTFFKTFSTAPPEVLAVEKQFRMPMPEDVVVTGRMDRIDRRSDGGVEIVDYKTGAPKKESDARKNAQLSIYALAAKEVFEWDPKRLVFYYLRSNEPVAVPPDEKNLRKAQEGLLDVARQFRAGSFPAKPSYFCPRCDYFSICPEQERISGDSPSPAIATSDSREI